MEEVPKTSEEKSSKRPRKEKPLSGPQIQQFLDKYPSGSEEEASEDSEDDYLEDDPCRDAEESASEPSDQEEEETEEVEVALDRRKRQWNWIKKDLPQVECMPASFAPLLLEDDHTPMSVFKLLFDNDLFNLLAQETNKYILFKAMTKTKQVSVNELHEFFGVLMLMSIVKIPQKRLYWSKDLRIQLIADAMTQKRFQEIFSILHISDNATEKKKGESGFDPYYKVRPLITKLNYNFQKFAKEESHQSIDEQMVPFKGHHSKKVYIKKPPKKWGYKLWVRAGSISGYMHEFEMAGDLQTYITNITSNLGESANVVLRLSNSLPKGTFLYYDNYFASPELFVELNKREIRATSTLQTNRSAKCPLANDKELKKKGRGSEDYRVDRSSEILICKWYDNKSVLLGSNFHSVQPVTPVKRYDRVGKKHITIPCPNIVKNYNKCMGGVDKADMLLSLYRSSLKSIKWYKRLMFHFVDMCIINSWILYKTKYESTMPVRDLTLIKFKLQLAKSLIQTAPPSFTGRQDFGRACTSLIPSDCRYDQVSHWPMQNETSVCAQRCKFTGCKSKTTFLCSKCKVALCMKGVPNCFYRYHNKE